MIDDEQVQSRWKAANERADAAVLAVADLKARGVSDITSALLAEVQRQLDKANDKLERLEWESGQGKA